MKLYCEALEKQRGAADGGAEQGGGTERERDGRREREEREYGWKREKGAEIKEEKTMAVNTLKHLSFSKQPSLFFLMFHKICGSQLVLLQDTDVTLDIKWQTKRVFKFVCGSKYTFFVVLQNA